MFTTSNTTKHKQNLLLWPTQYIFPSFGKKIKTNKCCQRLRSCALKHDIQQYQIEGRQKVGRATWHTRPIAINTIMGFWHIYWIGQHFSWDVSCTQLNCSREGSRVLQVQNPIKESTGYDQRVSSLEAEQVHTHTHTVPRPCCPDSRAPPPPSHMRSQGLPHSLIAQRLMEQLCRADQHDTLRVRRPAVVWLLSPSGQRQALSSHFYWVTTVTHSRNRDTARHFPTLGGECAWVVVKVC